MQNALLTKFIQKHSRSDIPTFRPGDTIKVHVKIKEGDKERLQIFEGTVIARNNTGMGESITVRKVSFGQGADRMTRSSSTPAGARCWRNAFASAPFRGRSPPSMQP